jgi:hypothetical protein
MINEDQSKQLERKLKDLMDRTEILVHSLTLVSLDAPYSAHQLFQSALS